MYSIVHPLNYSVFFFLKLLAGLRFSVHQQSEMDTSVKFDLQIRRYGNLLIMHLTWQMTC